MLLRKFSQSFKIAMALMVAIFSTGLLPTTVAYATHSNGNSGHSGETTGQEVCPDDTAAATFELTGGWEKTDDIDELTWDIPDKPGYTVTDVCYKASTSVIYPDPITDPVVSTVTNNNDELQNISHVSVYYTKNQSTLISLPGVPIVDPCGTGNAMYGVVPSGNYTHVVNTDGSITFTANATYTFASGMTASLPIPAETNTTACPVEPTVIPTPTVPTNDICGSGNIAFGTIPASDNYTFVNNTTSVTFTANTNFVFTGGLSQVIVNLPADSNVPCPIVPAVCETPTDGGVITQNTAGWTTYGDTEFVKNGLELSSNEWSGSYIKSTLSYVISDALKLGWTVEGTAEGASGTAIIFKTASGANIHYEPEPYSDDFWTNTSGILPANAGGQGGPYSGSLQDLLDTGGDQSIVATYFYFNSATENTIVLKSLSFNCTTYTFDKEGDVVGEDDEKVTLCHATGSVTNPYVKITVSAAGAFNGHLDDNHGGTHGDHQNGEDIIPEFTYKGMTYSQNWNAETGLPDNCDDAPTVTPAAVQFLNPTCENPNGRVVITATDHVTYKIGSSVVTGTSSYPAGTTVTVTAEIEEGYALTGGVLASWSHTFTAVPENCVLGDNDVCPNIEGSQTVVPAGMMQNTTTGECFTPGGRGGAAPGQVLGAATALPETLPSTGGADSPLAIIIASILAYGAAYFLQGRRLLGRKEALSA